MLYFFQGIVFVVDCKNMDVLGSVKSEFQRLLESKDGQGLPILIFLNKGDIDSNDDQLNIMKLETLLSIEGGRMLAVYYIDIYKGVI